MDASRPLLANDNDDDEAVRTPSPDCLSRYLSPHNGHRSSYSNGGDNGYSNGHASLHASCANGGGGQKRHNGNGVGSNGAANGTRSPSPFFAQDIDSKYAMMDPRDGDADDGGALCCRAPCTQWACWKWVFPDRVGDYDDFATSAQVLDRLVQQEKSDPELNCRLQQCRASTESSLTPSPRCLSQRMVRENRFPVCLCALNLLELLLCHLKLKEPLPLVCPCCGTENAELETSQQPSRSHPELRGFAALMGDASSLASAAFTHQLACADGGPAEVALAHVFAHSLLVLDAVWKQQLQRDPTTTLLHFREALVETRLRVVAFLSRRRTPLTLGELDAWSYHQRARCRSFRTTR
ncbi:hypothetical protein BBJ28_00004788 [Nothophytophthora sp. Chile5]|nr:hypothetical protein BBJ28_00004788 [Nothophytophthora sp. Chile5]